MSWAVIRHNRAVDTVRKAKEKGHKIKWPKRVEPKDWYVVKLDAPDKVCRRARSWCKHHMGLIPVHWQLRVYIEHEARWLHRMNDIQTFKFKNKEDAVWFKLIWHDPPTTT